jgi:hypothetical protein
VFQRSLAWWAWRHQARAIRAKGEHHDFTFEQDAYARGSSWYASPATHVGYELIGAGMLILAGGGRGFPLDYGQLERWTRVGYERGMRSRNGER